jgi:hypothetical protein
MYKRYGYKKSDALIYEYMRLVCCTKGQIFSTDVSGYRVALLGNNTQVSTRYKEISNERTTARCHGRASNRNASVFQRECFQRWSETFFGQLPAIWTPVDPHFPRTVAVNVEGADSDPE